MATLSMTLDEAVQIEPQLVDRAFAEFPIFDEAHREPLQKKFYDHYRNREIGQETISMFELALRRKLNEIMPLYNQHYLASQMEFDPLETINIKNLTENEATAKSTGTSKTEAEGTSATLSKSDAKSRAVASDLPQTQLSGTGDYATSAQDNISGTTATGEANDTQSSENTESGTTEQDAKASSTTSGFQGNRSALIMQYRASFVNVDMMVLSELEELFMLLWSNGDEFTERSAYYGYF